MVIKKILYATDFSEAGKEAFCLAASLARQYGSMLLIAHVSEREQYPVGELFDEVPPPDEEGLKELQALVPDDSNIKYEHRLLFRQPGSVETLKPADAILRCAEKEHADMIVIGTHGRTGLARLLMGGVAESVVRRATCPVVTIKHPNYLK